MSEILNIGGVHDNGRPQLKIGIRDLQIILRFNPNNNSLEFLNAKTNEKIAIDIGMLFVDNPPYALINPVETIDGNVALIDTNGDLRPTSINAEALITQIDNISNKADTATTLDGYGITDAYTKEATDAKINTVAANKADTATTLDGYGITDAYTKEATDAKINTVAANKADSATTLAGYGITDAYTKEATDAAIGTAVANKADTATTLDGYGITDAYTKEATDAAIDTAVANKADTATTLAGYGITDAYTKEATDAKINTVSANKANSATTLNGYGITDAYTKEATDDAISTAVANKANSATTLNGYGITDAYTKVATDDAISTAVANKANKATTLAGYGITDAYTKTEINTKISSVLHYKGSYASYSALINAVNDEILSPDIGDVYNINTAGGMDANNVAIKASDNVVYNGTGWDNISGTIDLSAYATTVAMNSALDNKANKATTLAGYGITDAYTKVATDAAISTAVANKANTNDVPTITVSTVAPDSSAVGKTGDLWIVYED